jgi:O-antigen ligase
MALTRAFNKGCGLLGLVVICLILARLLAAGGADQHGGVATTVWLVVGALLVAHLALWGPQVCFAALVGLSASGLADTNTPLATVGGVQITALDIVFVMLALQAFFANATWTAAPSPFTAAGRTGIALIVFMGASVVGLYVSATTGADVSFTGWVRIVQAAVLTLLAARLLTTAGALRRVLTALVLGGFVLVAQMIVEVIDRGGDPLRERFGGPVSQNTAGLVSAAIVVIAAAYPSLPSPRFRVTAFVVGLVGLFLAKSVGSLLSVSVILAALALGGRLANPGSVRAVRSAIVVGVIAILAIGVVKGARSEILPGSEQFGRSSVAQRVVVGVAGLELFARHPIVGVGWQRSSAADVIGDEGVNAELRERLPSVAPYFYPDVTPASVHNAYIQTLAELGAVGFVLLLAFLLRTGVAVRRQLKQRRPDDELYPAMITAAALGGLVLLWWNENPLYGGQFETITFALVLGMLIAISRHDDGAPRAAPV